MIVWESEDEDGDGYGIYAQRYSATGDAVEGVFQVNTLEQGNQTTPAIAMDADGDFVIVWETDASTDGLLDIMARRFHADGTPVANAPEFRVNQRVELAQKDPAIAMNANGQFVIAWVSDHPAVSNPDDTEKSIFVQTFAPNGSFAGEERLVHRYVKDAQEAPALGIDAKGNFVVGWQSINQDGNSWGVFARQFLADETPVEGREFVVNETRMGPQRYVGVGMDEVGRFVITWQSNSHLQDGSAWEVYARQYGIGGWREGGELPVNTYNMGPQIRPVVAQAPDGDFGVFWLGQGPDHIEGVHGRLYASHYDYGDAAEPYPTVAALDGPRHLVGSGVFLGTSVDLEPDGVPTLDATGDDLLGDANDEDGVQLAATLVARLDASIEVTASAAGKLDAWIDYNRDGVFSTAEQIALSHVLVAGANTLSISVPSIVVAGPSFARFRVSTAGGLAPTGLALDGEVEDYAVTIVDPVASSASVIDDPMRPGNPLLLVNGTGGADTITFAADAFNPQQIVVMRNGASMGTFANTAVGRIVAMGRLGPDVISVDKSIVLDTELHGNAGNDLLRGGGGNDVIYGGVGNDIIRGALGSDSIFGGLGNDILFGGADDDWMDGEGGSDWITSGDGSDIAIGNDGNDQVFAGLGRDILVGGLGSDTLYGQTDDDIVVGGPTNLSIAAYKEARIAWNAAEAFPTRVTNLGTVLNSSSVLHDAASDAIYGGPDRDWLLDYELNDFFLDFSSDPVIGDKLN